MLFAISHEKKTFSKLIVDDKLFKDDTPQVTSYCNQTANLIMGIPGTIVAFCTSPF